MNQSGREEHISTGEKMMQLIDTSEEYIGKMGRWGLRGALLTIILCLISAFLLLFMFSDVHVVHDRDLQGMFIGAIMICQFILIIWWSVYTYAALRDKRRTREWWDQNIRPLKERDASILMR